MLSLNDEKETIPQLLVTVECLIRGISNKNKKSDGLIVCGSGRKLANFRELYSTHNYNLKKGLYVVIVVNSVC